jgi:branched-chain amino acid aminotransferase
VNNGGEMRVRAEWLAEENVSVFESLKSYCGVIFKLEEHLDRLYASAKTVGIAIRERRSEITRLLYRALKRTGRKEAFLRITAAKGGIFVIAASRSYPGEIFKKGISVRTAAVKKNPSRAFYPEAKSSSYGSAVLATLEGPPEAFEILFLGEDGCIREARTSNVFMVKGMCLRTPPAAGILDGVTRRTVMVLAPDLGLEVAECSLTRHDLYNADEVFLTHTSGELVPVAEIDGRAIAKAPGLWTAKLGEAYRGVVERYIKEHRHAKG